MGDSTSKPRLVVFIIAYYAESTLRQVLDRIPSALFDEFDCHVLIVDDASDDRGFEIGIEYKRERSAIPITVLRNQHNQGYGGNQKVGYAFAIEGGFDYVAMVHGDGQYAPEELLRMVAPLVRGDADAVFGSRMLERFGALKGGMPLYKYVGNKILSTVQNALLRMNLSEFHSGYRVYSVAMLKRLPFFLNANDFHFDTEIIIQLLDARARIVELPIPTYYGDEICRVNGMKYAKDVVTVTAQYAVHRAGLLYQRRFDTSIQRDAEKNSHYDLKLGYDSSHTRAIKAVRPGSKVLDLGGGPLGVAQELVKKGCTVGVVDQAAAPSSVGVAVHVQDLDAPLSFTLDEYDTLLLLDVIEHLKDPELFLTRLREKFGHEPKRVILTTPNIAFVVQRLMLLFGQFNYGKTGILDRTHTRHFTFRSLKRLLTDRGFRIRTVRGVPAPVPKALGMNVFGFGGLAINQALIRLSKTLFSYQIYIEAETTPTVEFVLADTRAASEKRTQQLRSV